MPLCKQTLLHLSGAFDINGDSTPAAAASGIACWSSVPLTLEVSRFPESELHGPDSESEFGRSRPGVGVTFFRNWLPYRAVPIPLKELQGVWSNPLFSRNRPESESHFSGIGSPLV